jgi:serine phosphatase RsbU (regulator of sigma subunit)
VVSAASHHGASLRDQIVMTLAVHEALRRRPGATVTLTLARESGDWRLRASVGPGPDAVAVASVTVDEPPSEGPEGPHLSGLDPLDGSETLLALVEAQHSRILWYQDELDRTDRGTLELHAELDQVSERLREAADAQARLLEAERSARSMAEATRARLSFLAHAGATLSASLDRDQILGRLYGLVDGQRVARLGIWLGDDRHALAPHVPAPDADADRRAEAAADGEAPADAQAPAEVRAACETGRVHHATPHASLDVPNVTTVRAEREVLAIPLISRDRVLGVAAFAALAQPFTADDVAVYRELIRLGAVALDNALRYEHEHDVAQRLQAAMLTELPAFGRLEFAARYLPAEAGLNVGGDWYDAFERIDGHGVAAIGDVTGHGLRAATLMGQLRTALRAYAVDPHPAGEVLSRLHRLVSHLQPDDLATALLVQVAPDDTLHWANAGHLPLLLRGPDGRVRTLSDGDPLLGAPLDDVVFRTHTARLEPGTTFLMYTDGLVERRGASLEDGLRRLAEVLASVTGTLEQVADVLLEKMLTDSAREDDTCLLLGRITPKVTPHATPRADRVVME